MTAALCIFAYVVFSFAVGVLAGRLIAESRGPAAPGDWRAADCGDFPHVPFHAGENAS